MMLELPSILITDDDRQFRQTLQELLEPRGFRTLQARDGLEAVEIVQRESIHLLLLDLNMPRLSGLETIRLVKKIRATLPCILISANADAVADQAQQCEVFSVLKKPVSRLDVTNSVHSALSAVYNWIPSDCPRFGLDG